tara:strand:+ start:19065 stop:19685 length:621 start_codon:yes stop_codon:yes gene_type:complete
MKIVIKDIDKTKLENNNIFASTNEMLSLEEYIDISKRCIGHFASPDLAKQMLQSEDAISFVAEHLMMATCRHDEEKGRTLRSYHNQCAIWAIQNWVARISKNSDYEILSLNKELKDGGTAREMYHVIEDERPAFPSEMERQENMDRAQKLLSSPVLSKLEQDCISMKFLDEMSAKEIAEDLDINRKLVYTSIQKGLAKLREFHDED